MIFPVDPNNARNGICEGPTGVDTQDIKHVWRGKTMYRDYRS